MTLVNPYKRHLKWEPTGRIYEKLDELDQPTGELIWSGRIGEQQIQDEQEDWQPYIYDTETDELRYSQDDIRCEFQSGQQVIKKAGNKLVESLKLFVQREVGGQWQNEPHGIPTRQIRHDKRFLNGELVDHEGVCVGWLEFPDAQYDLQIGIQAGRAKMAIMGFRFRAPISANIRIHIVKDGIDDPGTYQLIRTDRGQGERVVGIKWKDFFWRWTYEEAAHRTVSVEDSIAYPGKKKGIITVGPFAYTANTWIEQIPDTWGLTETADDCCERDQATIWLGSAYTDIYMGDYISEDDIGWTWTNVTATGTANDGCYILARLTAAGAGGATGNLQAVDARDVAAWAADYRPDTHTTKHGAYVAWDSGGVTGDITSPEIKTLIQARFDDDHVSGDDIGIVWIETEAYGLAKIASTTHGTYSGGQLYIVYSTNGGRTTKNTDPWGLGHSIGMSRTMP